MQENSGSSDLTPNLTTGSPSVDLSAVKGTRYNKDIPTGDISVEEFFETYGVRGKGVLLPFAAQVYVIARYGGIRAATDYFSKKLGRKLSKRPIEDILNKIKRGEIVLTEAEIREEASKHPFAAKFFECELARSTKFYEPL
ncbi:MAG: hypothetical protein EBR40_00105 [Proteobacteria bacterium]|nr:hypothetical protein [Pseudomonadota bacterium]